MTTYRRAIPMALAGHLEPRQRLVAQTPIPPPPPQLLLLLLPPPPPKCQEEKLILVQLHLTSHSQGQHRFDLNCTVVNCSS